MGQASLWAADLTALVDFLEGHPAVDPSRLAVAGCSGGGVQSAYIGALDERLAAVSIACYSSTLVVDYRPRVQGGGGGPAEGEQQWGPMVGSLDKPDLLQVRAGRRGPTQILLTTRDQYFPLVGGQAAYSESLPAFVALAPAAGRRGQPGLELAVANNSHGYINGTRLALYDFLTRALQQRNDSGVEDDRSAAFFTFEQLRATSTGSVLTAQEINNGRGSVSSHTAFVMPIANQRLAKLRAVRQTQPNEFLRSVRANAGAVVGWKEPRVGAATRLPDGPSGSAVYSLPGEGRCVSRLELLPPLPLDRPAPPAGPVATVLYVGRKGGSLHRPEMGRSDVEADRLAAIRRQGFAVALLDPCGFGSLGNGGRTTCTTTGGNATGGAALSTRPACTGCAMPDWSRPLTRSHKMHSCTAQGASAGCRSSTTARHSSSAQTRTWGTTTGCRGA